MYDGYRAHPVDMNIRQTGSERLVLRCFGQNDDGSVFGVVLGRNNLVVVDLETGSYNELTVDQIPETEDIVHMSKTDESYVLVTVTPEAYRVYWITDAQVIRHIETPRDPSIEVARSWLYLPAVYADEEAVWIWEVWQPIVRIDLGTEKHRNYNPSGYINAQTEPHPWTHRNQIVRMPGGELWFYHSESVSGLFVWREDMDEIVPLPILAQGWKPNMYSTILHSDAMHTDLKGNVLLTYLDSQGSLRAQLFLKEGLSVDYTDVMRGIRAGSIRKIRSPDFTRHLITTGPTSYRIDVHSSASITAIQGRGSRGIAQIDENRLVAIMRDPALVNISDGTIEYLDWEKYDNCGDQMIDGAKIMSRGDEMWYVLVHDDQHKRLVKHNKKTDACSSFLIDHESTYFDFVHQDTIAVAAKPHLWLYDVNSGRGVKYEEDRTSPLLESAVNDLIVARSGLIYIASTSGVIEVNHLSRTSRWIDESIGMSDTRVTTLLEANDGKIWMGTFLGGVQVFDPTTGTVQVIDKDRGLSHDAVATILQDDEGDIWVATYGGVSVLSPEGDVIVRLYSYDGLVNDEANRWSALKLADGRLCFGSVSGLSVIDPMRAKRNYALTEAPRMFITSVRYLDDISGGVLERSAFELSSDRIVISPEDRSLRLRYGLSNMQDVYENQFAYMIEGIDDNWHYIGNSHNLTLSSLPIGDYNILLRGSDHRGQWVLEPIVIPVKVNKFFFQQWWFFVLCSIPFISFAIAWIIRQRQERRRLETEVYNRTSQIREQADQLKQLDIVKSRLYTNITHEFRTPLTVILGLMQQLRELDPSDAIRSVSDIVSRNAGNLLDLVNQMLDLRKLESGAMPLRLVNGDIVEFLRYITESFRSLAETKGVQFHFLADTDELVMDHDPEKIQRIVSNLLSNAVKFTPSGGDVYMHIDHQEETDPTMLVIRVRDTGVGIPADDLEKIFDRFYQVDDSSTRKGEGTGIGLTLVSGLVNQLEGNISATSKTGMGSTFVVKLPVYSIAEPADALYTAADQIASPLVQPVSIENPGQTTDGELPQLLIVEDNLDVVNFLVGILKDRYLIEIAMDGEEGIEKAMESVPDVIVSDVMMPIKDGFELCHTLKSDYRTSHIPIILLTAKADAESKLSGLRRGADVYMPKPFDKEELFVRLEKLVSLRKELRAKYAGTVLTGELDKESLEDDFILRLKQAVEDRLDDADLNVTILCKQMNLSRTQLHRKISALTGKSTTAFVRSIRLEHAKKLLANPDLNISEVAYSVGFRDPAYFSRSFSEEFGLSPSEYAQSLDATSK